MTINTEAQQLPHSQTWDILTIAAKLLVDAGHFGYSTPQEMEHIRRAANGDAKKLAAEIERVYHIRAKMSAWKAEQTDAAAAFEFALREYRSRYPYFTSRLGHPIPDYYIASAAPEAIEVMKQTNMGGQD